MLQQDFIHIIDNLQNLNTIFQHQIINIKITIIHSSMDVNQPKSRSFNMYLRYFQFGLQILIAAFISKANASDCSQTYQNIGIPASYIIIGFNLLAMIITRCSDRFPRVFFFISFAIDLVLAAIVVILGLIGMADTNSCANNRVLHRFVFTQGLIVIVLAFMIICLPFHWIQRYSNSPGNLTWVFLFFSFGWSGNFKTPMIILGILTTLVSVTSFLINLATCKGITTGIKKGIVVFWVFGLITMIVAEVLALVTYVQSGKVDTFIDIVAIKLLQTFICVNVLDFLFWLWGYITLQHQNGDKIRDQLMKKQDDSDSQYVQEYQMDQQMKQNQYGTIRY